MPKSRSWVTKHRSSSGPGEAKVCQAGKGWSLADCDEVMRRCVGAAIIGFPKWRFAIGDKDFRLATEYSHHEGAVARTYGLPLLTIAEEGLEPRLLFNQHAGLEIIFVPLDAELTWLSTKAFQGPFANWKQKLRGAAMYSWDTVAVLAGLLAI